MSLMTPRLTRSLIAILVGSALLLSPAAGAPGDLDRIFGGDGRVLTPVGASHDLARGGLILPNGRIVLVGSVDGASGDDFGLTRHMPSGRLDTSFGTGGKVVTPIGVGSDQAEDVARQPDGKLVVVGNTNDGSMWQIGIARYRSNGQLDPSFGTAGKQITTVGTVEDVAFGVAVQPDGKIVVVGSTSPVAGDFNMLLLRFLPNGDLDPSFGDAGVVIVPFGAVAEAAEVAVQRDGKIVVAGLATASPVDDRFDVLVGRFRPDGDPDPGFGGGDGLVKTAVGSEEEQGTDVAIQGDGKILVSGFTDEGATTRVILIRYLRGGALDGSFSGDGIARAPFVSAGQARASLALQKDGKVVVASHTGDPLEDFAVTRFKASGAVDKRFGNDGSVQTDFAADTDIPRWVALQKDGGIIAAGHARSDLVYDFALARYKNDLTFTSIKARKRRGRIKASGKIMPPRRGKRMIVSLYRRQGGRFRKIAIKRARLSRPRDIDGDRIKESTFGVSFGRPARGRCKLVATYRGDANYLPSKAVRRIRC